MASSYLIYPSLEERIQTSWLLERLPELDSRFFSDFRTRDLDTILEQLWQNNFWFSIEFQSKIIRALEEMKPWKLIRNWRKNEDWKDLFWNIVQTVASDTTDILLWTGLVFPFSETYDNEPSEEEIWELSNFSKYWFNSQLEMVMSLSAYRCRNVLQHKRNQYEWVNSKWIRNVITACEHGDTKFFQYNEKAADKVYSPFWNEVLFQPRLAIGSMTHVYHSNEPEFFSTFFRYAIELGILDEIMWENWEKFLKWSHNLPWYLWPYWDAWDWNYMAKSSFLFKVSVPIWWKKWRFRNMHTHSFAPWLQEWYLEFKVWINKELQIFDNLWHLVMQFLPEDAEHLLKWILHQCANGHGRTSKNQILELVKYFYSPEFQTQKDGLNL